MIDNVILIKSYGASIFKNMFTIARIPKDAKKNLLCFSPGNHVKKSSLNILNPLYLYHTQYDLKLKASAR